MSFEVSFHVSPFGFAFRSAFGFAPQSIARPKVKNRNHYTIRDSEAPRACLVQCAVPNTATVQPPRTRSHEHSLSTLESREVVERTHLVQKANIGAKKAKKANIGAKRLILEVRCE